MNSKRGLRAGTAALNREGPLKRDLGVESDKSKSSSYSNYNFRTADRVNLMKKDSSASPYTAVNA